MEGATVPRNTLGTREEWLQARLELLADPSQPPDLETLTSSTPRE
jgi:hypothetical protein